ncbi:MAG: endonuclease/exonuclease/phosphatase family protein [Dehalococcoidales bacterium]|nr:endonuclease/exonuclease/phosphatase family protein [Dehalococcoidales bacterium]
MSIKKHKFKLPFVIATVFLFLSVSLHLPAEVVAPSLNQIRLGSFNIEKLGKNNPYQTQNAATILKNYDIVAIQEVMNTGATAKNPMGTKGIEALKRIVASLGSDWGYVVSTTPNGTLNAQESEAVSTFEYYAFIYRKSKLELVPNSARLWDEAKNPIPGLKDQKRQFDRQPFVVSFKAKGGNLDFTLITIHVAAPAAKWRRDEIRRLKIVYEKVQNEDPEQNDVFLLGDFNTNVNKSEWDDLKSIPTMKHILTSKDVTTINKTTGELSDSQYDTIWYQGKYSNEDVFIDSAQVDQAWEDSLKFPNVKPTAEIKDRDNKLIWLYGRYASDHLPVTVILWVDRDADNSKISNLPKSSSLATVSDKGGKAVSELGVVYKGMPKEYLENAGFTEYLLIRSKRKGNKEWFTFSDWTTPESGDTITFIIEAGKVKDWVRESKKKGGII